MCDHRQQPGESQLAFVRRVLTTDGFVSAHDMTYAHGITRTAAIVHTLRHSEGMTIDTNDKPGHQAVYRVSPLRDDAEKPPTWRCLTCDATMASSAPGLLGGYAEVYCLRCGVKRLHRRVNA